MPEIRDRNVYILGAGFSADSGVPVVRDFIERSRQYFDHPAKLNDSEERRHFQRFLEFKRKMSQAREKVRIDLDNIEELFGLVEIAQRLDPGMAETRASVVYVIAKTIELSARSIRVPRLGFVPDKAILNKRPAGPKGFARPEGWSGEMLGADMYEYFASLACGKLDDPDRQVFRQNTFITFNYDLILDDALLRIGAGLNYHLPAELSFSELGQPSERAPSVLKLHGSTNWGICTKCSKQVIVLGDKVTASPAEFRSRHCTICDELAFQPLLIPPSWDKSEYRDIMRPIWQKAAEELKLASRICIIGYSMPEADSFFKFLLALGLSENHNLYKLIVVDRNEKMMRKYGRLLDPMFRQRRLSPYLNQQGFHGFLVQGGAPFLLGRGELVQGPVQSVG